VGARNNSLRFRYHHRKIPARWVGA
jgi:hypothetical protein